MEKWKPKGAVTKREPLGVYRLATRDQRRYNAVEPGAASACHPAVLDSVREPDSLHERSLPLLLLLAGGGPDARARHLRRW